MKQINRNMFRAGVFFFGALMVAGFFFVQDRWTTSGNTFNQIDKSEVWQDVEETSFSAKGERQIVPLEYRTLRLNKGLLAQKLKTAPRELSEDADANSLILSLPLPDGSFSRFRVVDSPIMEEGLAQKFPEIKTYLGQGIDEPTATTRFDITPKGFHALILFAERSVYIDPYSSGDDEHYIAYNKKDYANILNKKFECLVENDKPNALEYKQFYQPNVVTNAGTLRTYRLALAATGEYTAFQGGTVPLAMAAMTTSMNRVNAVYERDLSVRMNMVANNNLIVYTDSVTDPYTNNSGSTMLGQNQTNLDTVIGTANYDVGHVFSTGGGGVASLRSPCNPSAKARGVTGLGAPVGDPFDIDYVAHEMGHQFGGNHTFNGQTGSCSGGNRSASAAFEPGSGTTIQAYAGICGAQNLQRNSDDHFHVRSLEEMIAFTTNTATGGSCDTETTNVNIAPAVTVPTLCNVPQDTPFSLTATATDENGDALTYNWEQYDLGAAATSGNDNDADGVARPIFRSYPSRTTPTRIFPSLQFILNNANVPPTAYNCGGSACLRGEILPTINRTMNFQVTVRDNRAGSGGIRSAQTQVAVYESASGTNFSAFALTSQNTTETLDGGATQTVTWNTGNSNLAPINCSNVKISLSTNGGATFPIILSESTPNDGSENFIVPNVGTLNARLKIECVSANTCFFDINNANLTINAPSASLEISGRIVENRGRYARFMLVRLVNSDVPGLQYTTRTDVKGIFRFRALPSGNYTVTPENSAYGFAPNSRSLNLTATSGGLDFVATRTP